MHDDLRRAAVAGACALAACASPAPADEMRVLVRLVEPSEDGAAIARRATAAAGVPVRYLASSSASWHALALSCVAPAGCEAALRRLQSDSASFSAVQRDERRRLVTP